MKDEFLSVLGEHVKRIGLQFFSLVGLRGDTDFMVMADHFRIGHKYPKIKINTGYSFGLDDQEFVLAFEGDDPSEFLALVEDLRGSEASMYTQLETPIFTCARVPPARMLDLLG